MQRGSRRSRIFLGPIEIAGFFAGLEAGLREIGERADLHDISGDPFRYRRPRARDVGRAAHPATGLRNVVDRVIRGMARFVVFAAAVVRYDAFVIGGTGFWGGRELPILRALGKRVVWVFLGTDHRPPYLNGKFVGRGTGTRELATLTRRTAARVGRVERWADAIVAHEASAQFHRRAFVRLLEIGLPISVAVDRVGRRGDDREDDGGRADGDGADRDAAERRVTILHCPTDAVAKGSVSIREIVNDVGASEPTIEYREVVGRPHDDVLEAIASSDIVIDELYGDTPLGVLAAEAASLGTPTVCGGYFAGECRPLSDGTAFPVGFVAPEEMHATVRLLVGDAEERARRGASAAAFVRSRWIGEEVARRMLAVLGGVVPEGWMVDPAQVTYVDGYGLSRAERVAAVRAFVAREGEGALAMQHRPDLVRALIAT